MIRSTRDPGPSYLAVVVLVCAVILAALFGADALGDRLDEHVREQVETATCPSDAPVRPTTCEPRP